MGRAEFISGPNFSGRSRLLLARARELGAATYFIGPYAEAALSGLSSTIADEIQIYSARSRDRDRPLFERPRAALRQKPQSLSGGEQVLLALHCFSISAYGSVAIDTALEQLDARNRSQALDYLGIGRFDVVLTDNRAQPRGWNCTELPGRGRSFACDWEGLQQSIAPQRAPRIVIRHLSFGYRPDADIFDDAEVALEPGRAHRLSGPNGAGKTTLLKILVGALVPRLAQISLDDAHYEPWRKGNTALALATQNPDQQWCGATLREDMGRRRTALSGHPAHALLTEERILALARQLGVGSIDQHLYELPIVARKRISWLWPFAGAHPWIMLDEPTIGQDGETCRALARTLERLCQAGYGVMFVTHDDDFAATVPHRVLRIENKRIT
jgi:energy-coupling factor transporter ATP-binding protein EcfA2